MSVPFTPDGRMRIRRWNACVRALRTVWSTLALRDRKPIALGNRALIVARRLIANATMAARVRIAIP